MTALELLEPWLANAHSRSAATCLASFSQSALCEGAPEAGQCRMQASRLPYPVRTTAVADRIPINWAGTTNGAAYHLLDDGWETR
jgi:hypothetical protein